MDPTLQVNDQTEETFDAEDITEEECANPDNIDKEASVHPEYYPRKS